MEMHATRGFGRQLALLRIGAICLALVPAACSRPGAERVVVGSALPPSEVGNVDAKKSCPVPTGRFYWPNRRDVGPRGPREYEYKLPWNGHVPVASAPRMFLSIAKRPDGSVEIGSTALSFPVGRPNSRTGYRAMATPGGSRGGNTVVYAKGKFTCSDGMATFEPVPVIDTPEIENFGGKGLMRGFRLAVMDDGSLAVGLKNISTGNTSSLYYWGGQSFGPDFRAPNQVYWHWKRFDPVRGDEEVWM